MKALLCTAHGSPEELKLEDVPSPSPAAGEVLIEVRACGVNFPDTLIIQGKYQFKPDLPFAPGGEIAGVVKTFGEGVDRISVGDRVIAFTGWGAFAEEVVVNAAQIIPMPEGMDFVTAASFVMVYGTSHHALKDRAELRQDETLLVLGAAGGVGLAAVQIGKAMGARVIAAASTDEKLEICRRFGADEVINYASEDLRERLREITGKSGVDVVYDPVGGDLAEPALRSVGWKGRYLVVGFAAGDIPRIPLNLPLLKGCSVVGVFWGEFARREARRNAENLRELMEWLSEGRLQPHVSAVYPLERGGEALRALMNREVTGKVVLTTAGER